MGVPNDDNDGEAWATGQQIAARLPRLDGVEPDHPVVACGLLVDVAARAGVLAMPSETAVGLNLEGAPMMTRRVDGDKDRFEYSPTAASILLEYLTEHPEIARGVCNSAHKAPDGDEISCGKFIRGVSAEAAAAAMTWRKSKLPAELIKLDSLAEPPNPWKKAESAKHGTEQTEMDASKEGKKAEEGEGEEGGEGSREEAAGGAGARRGSAVPAWGGSASAKPPPAASMSQILKEQSTRTVAKQPHPAASRTPGIVRLPKGGAAPASRPGWRWMSGYPARPTHGGWIDHRVGRAVAGHSSLGLNPAPCASQAAEVTPERLSREP